MKESMEVGSVLAPQFVAPVVVVVICALAVFVFGFKHAPEPTFEYDSSDEKKYKKSKGKKKEKSAQSNGHIVNVTSNKPSASPQIQSKPLEKKDTTPKAKAKKVQKNMTAPEVAQAAELSEATVTDGWTTAVSKKDKKKNKRREPEDLIPQVQSRNDQSTVIVTDQPVVTPVVDPPLQQRSSSKKSSKNVKNKIQETVDDVASSDKTVQDGQTTDKAEKGVSKTEKSKLKDESLESKVEIQQNDDKQQTPSKKTKKKKKKAEESVLNTEMDNVSSKKDTKKPELLSQKQPIAPTELPVKPAESIENQLAEAMRESPSPPSTPGETKPSKSPKKNKKKQKTNKEEGNKSAASSSPVDTSHKDSLSQEVPSAIKKKEPDNKSIPKPTDSSPVKETSNTSKQVHDDSSKGGATALKTSTVAAAGDTQPTSVSFDELGEWQEAKPVKKRKKPRRDN